MVALLGNVEGGLLYWGSGRIWGGWLRGWASHSLSTGDLRKALETAISVHRGPVGMHVGGGSIHQEL